MADLPRLLAERLNRLPDIRRWVIAFSGGVDSRVLLELCARGLPRDALLAVHVNHALQPDADTWAGQCQAQCRSLGIACRVLKVDPGSGSEADLRRARYGAFRTLLEPGDCLLLAHHADDQIETFLLRLMRGAGLRGLAGMPSQRAIGPALLFRPLLDRTREELEQWARREGLEWIEDPSNAEARYERNWLRHRIIVPLRERWPQLSRRLTRTTAQLAESVALLDEIAHSDLDACQRWPERLPLAALTAMSPPRQRNLLRCWVQRESGHWLEAGELARLEREVIGARDDAVPALRVGERWLRRYRGELYLVPASPVPGVGGTLEVVEGVVTLAQGTLTMRAGTEPGLVPGQRLQLKYRRGGERLRPLGRGGSVTLKQLMQEAGIPPWWRAGWPLLFDGDRLVAVPGICLCEGAVEAGGIRPLWQPFGLSEPRGFGRL